MILRKHILLVVLAIFLGACGGPSAIMIKPEQKQNIKTIALLEVTNPPTRMFNLGTGFGAVGVAASFESKKLE